MNGKNWVSIDFVPYKFQIYLGVKIAMNTEI